MASTIRTTLGPSGHNVHISGQHKMTKDGFTIVNDICLADDTNNAGILMLKTAAENVARLVEDGTTRTVILAETIYKEGLRSVRTGADPIKLTNGINKAVDRVISELIKMSIPVTTDEQMMQIIKTATYCDETTSNIVIESFWKNNFSIEHIPGNEMTKRHAEDAVNAIKSTIEIGMVPGGGIGMLNAIPSLNELKLSGDEKLGADIIKMALREPVRQLALNEGLGESEYLDSVPSDIVDSTKVIIVAIQNAAKAAITMLISK